MYGPAIAAMFCNLALKPELQCWKHGNVHICQDKFGIDSRIQESMILAYNSANPDDAVWNE